MTKTDRPLRISILIHRTSMSGGARVTARYARLLADRGHIVKIFGLGRPKEGLKSQLKRLLRAGRRPGGAVTHYENEGLEPILFDDQMALAPADLPDADVVIATFWVTAEWMKEFPPEKGAKFYFVQGHEAALPHSDRARVEKTYAVDAKMITISNWLADILRNRYGRNDVAIVMNGVDRAAFAPVRPRAKNRTPTVGFLGSKNALKRTDLAIATCERLKSQFAELRVRVFSAHKAGEGFTAPNWFEFDVDPSPQQIAAIYSDCDVWLFASDEEGFGLPMLEALACGTPVVARPAGVARELINDRIGALIPSAEPADIAAAAAGILALDAAAWKEMSDAALATAATHDWESSVAAFEAVLLAHLKE